MYTPDTWYKTQEDITSPVNIGNPDEHTIKEFATIIKTLVNSSSKIVNLPPTEDDPQRRRPDISKAKTSFNWEPRMPLDLGKQNKCSLSDCEFFLESLCVITMRNKCLPCNFERLWRTNLRIVYPPISQNKLWFLGLQKTIDYFKNELAQEENNSPNIYLPEV